MVGTRPTETRLLLATICLFVAGVGLWNVAHYPPMKGYDATDHIDYALGLVPGGSLPHDSGEYYTPPGYYALAGATVWIAGKLGLGAIASLRAAMSLNVIWLTGTVILTYGIAAELWPGRRRLALAAAGLVAFLPVVIEAEAMFHPDTLTLFLSTLCVWLGLRTLAQPRWALGLGVALGAAQLVNASTLWAAACVGLALVAARRWRSLAVVAALAIAIPAPWYVHQSLTYGGLPFFAGRPPTPQAHTATGSVKPLYDRQPVSFYIDPGLPALVSAPYQPHFADLAMPMAYAGIWGDYFGVWDWVARPKGPYGTKEIFPPAASTAHRLTIQSLVGLLPTLLAIAGWLALLPAALRRPGWALVAALPLLGLLSYLYFGLSYPTSYGGTLKTSFMLSTAPGWALGFGYALDRLRGRSWLLVCTLLAVCALVDLTFIVYP